MVTPIAYVEFVAENEQVVVYTSHMSSAYPHIFVYDIAADIPNADDFEQPADYRRACEENCALYISFKRNLGKDTVNGRDVLTCDIDGWQSMYVYVRKTSGLYAENKAFYLNGKKIVVSEYENSSTYEGEYYMTFSIENMGLKRSNPNGRINGVVNTIEYK